MQADLPKNVQSKNSHQSSKFAPIPSDFFCPEWTFKSQAKMWYQIYYQSILRKCQHRSQIFWASFFLVSVPKFQTSIPAWNYFVCRFTTKFVTTSARSVLKHLLQLLISGNTWPLMDWEKSSLATFAQKRKVFNFTHLFFPGWTLSNSKFSPIFSFHNRDSAIFHRKKHTQQYTHFCSICNKGFYKSSCVSIKATSIQPLGLIGKKQPLNLFPHCHYI